MAPHKKKKKGKAGEKGNSSDQNTEESQIYVEEMLPLVYTLGILLSLGILGWLLTPLSFKTAFSLSFAVWFYLVLPGFCVLLNLNLEGFERVILAFPVSGAFIPLLLYQMFASLVRKIFSVFSWRIQSPPPHPHAIGH